MLQVGNTLVEDGIGEANFACRVEICRGACCTLKGGRGAPLLESELSEIEKAYPVVRDLLPEAHLEQIGRVGLFEGLPGQRTTVCHDDAACVFVYYEEGIARCSIERRYLDGKLTWRKPVSCHLFPVRVDPVPGNLLRYESMSECESARQHGKASGTPLGEFLREALIRRFGAGWYEEFVRTTGERKTKNRYF